MYESADHNRRPLIIWPDQGRRYDMGRMRAGFFADRTETAERYSILEWWLEPRTCGPGPHAHPEDCVFYVLTGTLSLVVDSDTNDAPRGSYALIPGGVQHDFDSRGAQECGFISINTPAGFEKAMPSIVQWFAEHPLGDVTGAPT